MRNLCGKTALITGVASGIGRALALRMAGEGVRLYLVDIDEVGLRECIDQCRDRGIEAVGHCADLSLSCEVSGVVANALDRWGGVDILINNAGISYYGRTHKMADEHWDRLLAINLHAPIQLTRALLPSMLARPEAHVVNVCSVFGLVAVPKVNAYCVSKFALVGFSEALRAEYGRDGLGVTAMCPGFVDTKLFTSAPLADGVDAPKEPPQWLRTTSERVAQATIRAIRRNRRVVVVEPFARGLFTIKWFAPGLMDFVLHLGRRRRIRKKLAQLEASSVQAVNVAMHGGNNPGEPPRERRAA